MCIYKYIGKEEDVMEVTKDGQPVDLSVDKLVSSLDGRSI
jgi:hypothetical protein